MRLTSLKTLAWVGRSVGAALLFAACFLPAARGAAPRPPAAPARPATGPAAATKPADPDVALARQMAARVKDLKFDGVAFADALDFLRDVCGVNLVVDWPGVEAAGVPRDAPISVAFRGETKVADVLARVLATADKASKEKGHRPTAWDSVGGVVIVAPPGRMSRGFVPAAALAAKAKDDKSKAAMARVLPELKFDGVALGDVLDFFKDVAGLSVDADWTKLAAAGLTRDMPVSVRLKDVSAGRALNLILFAAGPTKAVDFTVRDGTATVIVAGPATGPGVRDPKKP